jgi:mRNA interferase MazF
MITSAENASWAGDVAIADLHRAGLTGASVIRPAKLATVDISRVVRIAGSLGAQEAKKFRAAFDGFLAEA